MKITDMKVHMMQVPLVRPFRISLGVITHAVSCLVEIETDAGITGYGEGSPGPLITGENLPGTVETLRVFREKLIGMDPRDIEGINAVMNRAVAYAGTAKAAVDIACHDILGKAAGLPLYKLLGGLSNTIETDMTVGIDTPELMAAAAKEHVAAGFRVIKTKVGTNIADDIARVKAIPGLHPDGFSHHRLLPHGWPLLWQYRLRYSFQPWSLSHGSLQPHAPLRQQP